MKFGVGVGGAIELTDVHQVVLKRMMAALLSYVSQ